MNGKTSISVIIPAREGDWSWCQLLPDLKRLDANDEIILSLADSNLPEPIWDRGAMPAGPCAKQSPGVSRDLRSFTSRKLRAELQILDLTLSCPLNIVVGPPGRARQLNVAADGAQGPFLWFLHSDSRLEDGGISKLRSQLNQDPNALYFFDLRFQNDGPRAMAANALGAWVRSRILRLPFGDQGLCLSKSFFSELGGFSEEVSCGEDHHFVWKAHQGRIRLRAVGASLATSARRYQTHGWGPTTARHLRLTYEQAAPEFARLLKIWVGL